MKLKSFSVERYRSITKAKKIRLDKATVLVGPNNEGKSNLLRALVLGMSFLTGRHVRFVSGNKRIYYYDTRYKWDQDFPVDLQTRNPTGQSVIIFDFELTNEELEEFRRKVGSTITGSLPLKIAIGANGGKISFHKRGQHSAKLSAKSDEIADYVSSKLQFEHIAAVRTAESAEEIVNAMVARELSELEQNSDYRAALKKIEQLQQPILDALSGSILKTLKQFLPQVKAVIVKIRSEERVRALRRAAEIVVNDGTPTLLSYKGDGAQSLAALAIIRHASERGASGKNLVIAIEEPESHLHPNAIHELKNVIDALSERHQIILTTHNPLFVDRRVIGNNIIVQDNKAWSAKRIEEVRDVLGVRASDNLRHAELVLIVEGEEDRIAIDALLRSRFKYLDAALENGTLAIDTLGGASNLTYKITQVRACICLYHVFLDYDRSGTEAFKKAKHTGLIEERDVNFARCPGLTESEIEDLYDLPFYEEIIRSKYRVSLRSPKFKSNKKWSDRVQACFIYNGKPWDSETGRDIKIAIARAVAANPPDALNKHHEVVFDALGKSLEDRLKDREKAVQEVNATD